jgi:hypothetical protein
MTVPCCCSVLPKVTVSLSGVGFGSTVTLTASAASTGRCPATILSYYWWDCATAQKEAGFWRVHFGDWQDWQNYGWRLGGPAQTATGSGGSGDFGFIDIGDTLHWNWIAGVIYSDCENGHLRVRSIDSTNVEFTWKYKLLIVNSYIQHLYGEWTL